MIRFSRALLRFALAPCLIPSLAAALVAGTAAAEAAPAGTRIVNIAQASYFHEGLGIRETAYSNRVEAVVQAVPAVDVVGGARHRLARGAREEHHFEIRNTGNTDLTVSCDLWNTADAATIRAGQLVLDLDGNGVADAADPVLTPGQSMTLPMHASVELIYVFEVSAGASAGDRVTSVLDVRADGPDPDEPVAGTTRAEGRVVVVDQALELQKSATHRAVDGGEELNFHLRLRNDSERPIPAYSRVGGAALTIDGAAAEGILVRDDIPLNTVFAAHGETGGFTALYHIAGDPAQSYLSTAPADLSRIDAVAFFRAGDYPVGRSSDLSFRVHVPDRLGSLTVRNVARAFLPASGGADHVLSNPVTVEISSLAPGDLSFLAADTGEEQAHAGLGSDTALRFVAGACNATRAADMVEIFVTSTLTGDSERLIARETGGNTGVFVTAPLPLVRMGEPVSQDGVMAALGGDRLTAHADCEAVAAMAELSVEPGNFVFDSSSNAAIAGAEVRVIDAGGTVAVRAETDTRGYFSIGRLPAGRYRIEVGRLDGFAFPSLRRDFRGFGRRLHVAASYGGAFSHAGGLFHPGDLPVDPDYAIPVALSKRADRATVPTGGVVAYTLTATNRMAQALIDAAIVDNGPQGLDLVPGSVTIDSRPAPDPVADAQGGLRFALGNMTPGQVIELGYVMRVTPNARAGEAVNTATLAGRQAGTGRARRSAPARATVRHDNTGGVLSREATIIGSVFLDCNGNGIRDGADEPGVPGVRIVTQQGLSVVTDVDGKFSLFGLRPRAHVLAVQSRTLPEDAEVAVTRTADMLRAGTRLAALNRGEMRVEHFALAQCTPATRQAVAARVKAFADRAMSASALNGDLPIEASRPDRRSARSEAGVATTTQIERGAAPAPAAAPEPALAAGPAGTLEEILRSLTPSMAFLGLADGVAVPRRTLSVRVKGKADLDLQLALNGTPVGPERIGERSAWPGGNVQAIEYVALPLRPGPNELLLTGTDPFGNVRERKSITVHATGEPARLDIVAPETAPAAAGSIVPVVVRILDAAGRPVQASAVVTLTARTATWDVTDIRRDKPGIQAFVDNGEATFGLIPPQVAGSDVIAVESAIGRAEARIGFAPDLQERILVGVIEGAVRLKGGGDLIEPGRISPFEDTATGLGGELYLKGRIRGDALLTLRYSSDRDTEDRLFRDIRGDEYYPVYGDNSERGFDAQSSGNLYVKIERGQSYMLYGDIAIEPESPAIHLGGYSRLATGAKAQWEGERVRVTVFAAHTAQSQRVVEFPGRGISGPYDLDLTGFREGSDRVKILVRDERSGAILSSEPLRRFDDYLLDFFTGSIVFDAPVAQADREGNPVSVRVTIETEDAAADRHWLYGGEVNYQLTDQAEAGLRVVHNDSDPLSGTRERIRSTYFRSDIGTYGRLEAEIGHAERGDATDGMAARLAYTRNDARSRFRFEASHAGVQFAPTGSSLRPGSDRVAVSYDRRIDERLAYALSATYLADRLVGTETLTAEATARRRISPLARSESGLKIEKDLKGQVTQVFALLGAEWREAEDSPLAYRLALEAPLRGRTRGKLEMGFGYDVRPDIALSGDISLVTGPEGRLSHAENAKLGLEYRINSWLKGRSELTGSPAATGRPQMRAQQRVEAEWLAAQTLGVRAAAEHSQTLAGGEDRLTSLALGAEFQSADGRWVADGDLDKSWEATGATLYANLGLAGRVSPDLTVLGRSRFAREDRDGQPEHLRHRSRLGLAYRPVADPRLELLAWYEQRLDQKTARRKEEVWAVQGSYEASGDLRLNGKYAGMRAATETEAGSAAESTVQLVQAGFDMDFAEDRLALGLNLMRLWDDAGNSREAAGLELGYVLAKGAMVAVGYNRSYGDRLDAGPLYRDGAYLMVRMTLDDSLWDRLAGFAEW